MSRSFAARRLCSAHSLLLSVTLGLGACSNDSDHTAASNPNPDGPPITGVTEARSSLARELHPDVSQDTLYALTDGQAAFALDLFAQLNTQPGNLFYSPLSIHQALTMAFAGASGDTAAEMAAVLHIGGFGNGGADAHPAENVLDLSLSHLGDPVVLEGDPGAGGDPLSFEVANSMWGSPALAWEQPFLDTLAVNYSAGLKLTDFTADPEAARGAINHWVSQKTNERIPELLGQGTIDAMTRLVLVNAIFFKGSWAEKFEETATKVESFTLPGDGHVDVPMMHAFSETQYAAGEGYQAATIPYVGGRTSMLLIVPEDMETFESTFDAGEYAALLGRMGQREVDLALPKFEFKFGASLSQPLQALGMAKAFSGDADFSALTHDETLSISDVVHQAFVKVDESGTEAAAATAVVFAGTAAPVDPPAVVHADRPFIFLIRDEQTQAILFVGRVENPAE